MKKCTALYVEDDVICARNSAKLLEVFFKNVKVVHDAESALTEFQKNRYEVVISDIELPGMNGIELSKNIREINKKTILILLTSHVTVEYLRDAVTLGLSEYLEKPLIYEKIHETLKMCAEKIENDGFIKIQICEHVSLNLHNLVLQVDGDEILLSAREARFLELLSEHRNVALKKETLVHELWEGDFEEASDNALRNMVLRIRKKLNNRDIIKNISGYGYILVEECV